MRSLTLRRLCPVELLVRWIHHDLFERHGQCFPLTPIAPHQFDALIDRTHHNRKALKRRNQLRPLIVPSPKQQADGLWREQIFIAADAVILAAIDLLVEAGVRRPHLAMDDVQISIIGALNSLDAGYDVELAYAHDGKHFVVVTAATVPAAMHLVVEHYVARGVTDPDKLAVYCVPLRQAYQTVRARAKKHKVDLPPNMCLRLRSLTPAPR